MGWIDLAEHRFRRADSETTRIAVEKAGLRISVAPAALARHRWVRGAKLTLLVGNDEDIGLVRIVAAAPKAPGWTLTPISGDKRVTGLMLKLRAQRYQRAILPCVPDRLKSTPVETRILDDGIEFRLPWPVDGAQSISGAGAEPEGKIAGKAAKGAPDATAEPEDAGGRTGGSIPPTGAKHPTPPPEPKPFPVQSRSLAEVDRYQSPNDPTNLPPQVRAKFIAAARKGESTKTLAEIAVRPLGSIGGILDKYLPEVKEDRRRTMLARIEPAASSPAPAERRVASEQIDAPVPLSESVLRFLREEIDPVLKPMGRRVTKTADGSALLLDGKPTTADALVKLVKEILGNDAEDLRVPDAAE